MQNLRGCRKNNPQMLQKREPKRPETVLILLDSRMIASERAYVHLNQIRWISHRSTKDDRIFWRIRPQWINSGNTLTRRLRVYVHYELRDNERQRVIHFGQNYTLKCQR
jgi:hypothetical protein